MAGELLDAGQPDGLLTGYYEPLLTGSRMQERPNQVPLRAIPTDLLTIDLSAVQPQLKGLRLRGRLDGQRVVPYADRREIETRETKRGYATQPVIAWLDDPVEMARWVHAQAGDRLLLILSHRRDAMMAQYAKIKHIAATTGIRRFGVLFVDVEQVARGRENFLNLAGCARRFLSVQLDVVVGSCRDETGLRTWSGLSLAELAQFQWSTWSGAGMPALEENGFSGGVAH